MLAAWLEKVLRWSLASGCRWQFATKLSPDRHPLTLGRGRGLGGAHLTGQAKHRAIRSDLRLKGDNVFRRNRLLVGLGVVAAVSFVAAGATTVGAASGKAPSATTTPIQHLVVIFQENVSF